MTPTQFTAFKTALLAETDPGVVALRNQAAEIVLGHVDGAPIAAFYNSASTTDIWKTAVPVAELIDGVVWADFIAATVQRQNAWFALTQGATVDPRVASIRAGFAAVFPTGASAANLAALAKQKATRFEALFASGNDMTDETARGVAVTEADVRNALV